MEFFTNLQVSGHMLKSVGLYKRKVYAYTPCKKIITLDITVFIATKLIFFPHHISLGITFRQYHSLP